MKKLLIIALTVCIPMIGFAKKPKKNEVSEPVPQEQKILSDEECLAHLSLCHESVKNEQFEDAYPVWLELYQSRPDFHKNIYIDGDKILEYKYTNAQTVDEKNMWREMIMKLHDERILYFDDPKYPDAYVLGLKAMDYIDHYPEDELAMPAYAWLKESVAGMGANSQIIVLRKFVELSYNIYKSNPDQYSDQFLKDYQTVSGLMDEIIKGAANALRRYNHRRTILIDCMLLRVLRTVGRWILCMPRMYGRIPQTLTTSMPWLSCTVVWVVPRARSILRLPRLRINCNRLMSLLPGVQRCV